MVGKVDPENLGDYVFSRTGAPDESVLVGPAYGEDTAAIDLGDQILVVNADPISLAVERIGTLGVTIATNDLAASGADPGWLTTIIFLPKDHGELLDPITEQLDAAARELDVAIVGGHSEYARSLEQPLLSLTCFGLTDNYIASSGADPGDAVLLTKGAGIEGSAILATDFRTALEDEVSKSLIDEAAGYFGDISVLPESRVLRQVATAMHDPTEGGLIDGLLEVAVASDVRLEIDRERIPIREPTRALCAAMEVDPLAIFGSGALVATVPEAACKSALDDLAAAGIDAARIGTVAASDDPGLQLDGRLYTEPIPDDLYALWEE
ncbi:MAG: AIR synthase family protein [Halobacteriales archaeon]